MKRSETNLSDERYVSPKKGPPSIDSDMDEHNDSVINKIKT